MDVFISSISPKPVSADARWGLFLIYTLNQIFSVAAQERVQDLQVFKSLQLSEIKLAPAILLKFCVQFSAELGVIYFLYNLLVRVFRSQKSARYQNSGHVYKCTM